VIVLLVGPLVVVTVLRIRGDSPTSVDEAVELTAVAQVVTLQASAPGILTVEWAASPALLAGPWSGIVTQVSIAPGDEISEGDPVAVIDGVTRIAAATARPFYRPLPSGVQGEDVAELQDLLRRLGALGDDVETGRIDRPTMTAVRSLAALLGVPQANTSIFDPSWVAWMPYTPIQLATTTLRVGQVAPTVGAVVAETPSVPTSAALDAKSTAVAGQTGDVVVIVDPETSIPVRVDRLSGEVLDQDQLSRLGDVVAVGATEIDVTVSEPDGSRVVSAPGAALVRSADGGCVWTRSTPGGAWQAYTFATYGESAGNVTLEGMEAIDALGGAEVLLNSGSILLSNLCPS
jgi:hypothetical protein